MPDAACLLLLATVCFVAPDDGDVHHAWVAAESHDTCRPGCYTCSDCTPPVSVGELWVLISMLTTGSEQAACVLGRDDAMPGGNNADAQQYMVRGPACSIAEFARLVTASAP